MLVPAPTQQRVLLDGVSGPQHPGPGAAADDVPLDMLARVSSAALALHTAHAWGQARQLAMSSPTAVSTPTAPSESAGDKKAARKSMTRALKHLSKHAMHEQSEYCHALCAARPASPARRRPSPALPWTCKAR